MSLQQMREELRRKYERLCKREEERRKTILKYYEPIKAEAPPWLPPLKWKSQGSNPNTWLENLVNRVRILSEYGKDPEAEALLRKLAISFILLRARDFWKYIYDWTEEAKKLLEARKIEVEAVAIPLARR